MLTWTGAGLNDLWSKHANQDGGLTVSYVEMLNGVLRGNGTVTRSVETASYSQ